MDPDSDHASNQLLDLPSDTEISENWGRYGSFYRGPERVFAFWGSPFTAYHTKVSENIPSPLRGVDRIPLQNATNAARYTATRPLRGIKKFWIETIAELRRDGRFADAGTGIDS